MGWQSYRATETVAFEEFNERQLVVSKSAAAGVELFLRDIIREMREVAAEPGVWELDETRVRTIIEEKRDWLNADDLGAESIIDIGIEDVDGIVRYSAVARHLEGTDLSGRRYFQEISQAGSSTEYAIELIDFRGVDASERGVALGVPIFAGEAADGRNEFVGAVVAILRLDSITDRFIAPIYGSGGAFPFLVSKDYEVLWSPEKKEIGRDLFNESEGFAEFRQVLRKMAAGEASTGEYTYYKFDQGSGRSLKETEAKLIAYSPVRIGNGSMSVGISAPRDEARRLISAATQRQLTLVGSIIFFIFLGSSTAIGLTARTSGLLERQVKEKTKELVENEESQSVISSLLRLSLEDIPSEELFARALESVFSISWIPFVRKGAIFVIDDQSSFMEMKAQVGLSPGVQAQCAQVKPGECYCGQAASTQEVQFTQSHDGHSEKMHDSDEDHGHYSVPIIFAGETLGVLNVYLKKGHERSAREDEFLDAVANALAGIMRRKRSEHERDRSEEHYRSLVESSPDCICDISLDGKFLSMNFSGCRFNEIESSEDIIGEDCTAAIARNRAEVQAAIERAVRGETVDVQYMSRSESGREIWWESKLTPVWGRDNRIISILRVSRDITDRKKAETAIVRQASELARSNEDLEQFAYVASHDLQEPLRMVSSYVQLLARRYQGRLDKDADDFIGFAVDGAARMKSLIDDLLEYSRVKAAASLDEIDCETLLSGVLKNLKSAIVESGARVSVGHLPTVKGDTTQLTQLFQNLISNAIKFRGDTAPAIEVTAKRTDEAWIFSVSDNGIGIDPAFKDRIFMLFQRLHHKNEYSGTGMGLAICKKIVERHGGRIWVESEPGKGATFSFTIHDNSEEERGDARASR